MIHVGDRSFGLCTTPKAYLSKSRCSSNRLPMLATGWCLQVPFQFHCLQKVLQGWKFKLLVERHVFFGPLFFVLNRSIKHFPVWSPAVRHQIPFGCFVSFCWRCVHFFCQASPALGVLCFSFCLPLLQFDMSRCEIGLRSEDDNGEDLSWRRNHGNLQEKNDPRSRTDRLWQAMWRRTTNSRDGMLGLWWSEVPFAAWMQTRQLSGINHEMWVKATRVAIQGICAQATCLIHVSFLCQSPHSSQTFSRGHTCSECSGPRLNTWKIFNHGCWVRSKWTCSRAHREAYILNLSVGSQLFLGRFQFLSSQPLCLTLARCFEIVLLCVAWRLTTLQSEK